MSNPNAINEFLESLGLQSKELPDGRPEITIPVNWRDALYWVGVASGSFLHGVMDGATNTVDAIDDSDPDEEESTDG